MVTKEFYEIYSTLTIEEILPMLDESSLMDVYRKAEELLLEQQNAETSTPIPS